MPDALKTLFLNPPSFEGYDGGAGSRYQCRREVRSFGIRRGSRSPRRWCRAASSSTLRPTD